MRPNHCAPTRPSHSGCSSRLSWARSRSSTLGVYSTHGHHSHSTTALVADLHFRFGSVPGSRDRGLCSMGRQPQRRRFRDVRDCLGMSHSVLRLVSWWCHSPLPSSASVGMDCAGVCRLRVYTPRLSVAPHRIGEMLLTMNRMPNQCAPASRRSAGKPDGSGEFRRDGCSWSESPAAVVELGRCIRARHANHSGKNIEPLDCRSFCNLCHH